MRQVVFALLILLTLCSLAVADEWHKTYTVSGVPSLMLRAGDGHLQITAWDQKAISAEVITEGYKIGPDDVRIEERQTGDEVSIEVRVPHGHWCIGYCRQSIHVELKVPRESKLDLRTSDGGIDGSDLRGDLNINTGDGHIELYRLDGKLRAHSNDGHITVQGRFDALDLRTSDGSIHAEVEAGSKIASGWTAHSGDGSIHLRLPENFAADLFASTGDGSINVELPLLMSGNVSRRTVHGKLNGGGPLLEVHTGDGSIEISKEISK